jgi:hypothetical protein
MAEPLPSGLSCSDEVCYRRRATEIGYGEKKTGFASALSTRHCMGERQQADRSDGGECPFAPIPARAAPKVRQEIASLVGAWGSNAIADRLQSVAGSGPLTTNK